MTQIRRLLAALSSVAVRGRAPDATDLPAGACRRPACGRPAAYQGECFACGAARGR